MTNEQAQGQLTGRHATKIVTRVDQSVTKPDVAIVTFTDGSQTNVTWIS